MSEHNGGIDCTRISYPRLASIITVVLDGCSTPRLDFLDTLTWSIPYQQATVTCA